MSSPWSRIRCLFGRESAECPDSRGGAGRQGACAAVPRYILYRSTEGRPLFGPSWRHSAATRVTCPLSTGAGSSPPPLEKGARRGNLVRRPSPITRGRRVHLEPAARPPSFPPDGALWRRRTDVPRHRRVFVALSCRRWGAARGCPDEHPSPVTRRLDSRTRKACEGCVRGERSHGGRERCLDAARRTGCEPSGPLARFPRSASGDRRGTPEVHQRTERAPTYGTKSNFPLVARDSKRRCASAACASGSSRSTRTASDPSRTQPSTSPARCASSSLVPT
jgi:hypothetical protein